MYRLACLALLCVSVVLGGCGHKPEGACIALDPHFPERVHPDDTAGTKRAAVKRNVAFEAACPKESSWLTRVTRQR